jgi:hypothetical protein
MDYCKEHRHIKTLILELTKYQFEMNIKLADDDAREQPQKQRLLIINLIFHFFIQIFHFLKIC